MWSINTVHSDANFGKNSKSLANSIRNSIAGAAMLLTATSATAQETKAECTSIIPQGVSQEATSCIENMTPQLREVANRFQKVFSVCVCPTWIDEEKARVISIFLWDDEMLKAIGIDALLDERMTDDRIFSMRHISLEVLKQFKGDQILEIPTSKLEEIGYGIWGNPEIVQALGVDNIMEMSNSQIEDMRFMVGYHTEKVVKKLGVKHVIHFGHKKTHAIKFMDAETLLFIGGKALQEKELDWIFAIASLSEYIKKRFHKGSWIYDEISMAGNLDAFNEIIWLPSILDSEISIEELEKMTSEEIIGGRKFQKSRNNKALQN